MIFSRIFSQWNQCDNGISTGRHLVVRPFSVLENINNLSSRQILKLKLANLKITLDFKRLLDLVVDGVQITITNMQITM